MTVQPVCSWGADAFPADVATIQQSDKATIQPFVDALNNRDVETRKTAIENLTWLGKVAVPAIPSLLNTLQDEDPIVRAMAARAVWEIDGRSQESVPVLVRLLASQEASHRELAVYFLGPMGPAAKATIPELQRTIQDSDAFVRIHAAEALTQIDPSSPEPVRVLLNAMQASEAKERSQAAMAFSNVDPIHAQKILPILTSALVDPDPGVRTAAELVLPHFNQGVARSERAASTAEQTPPAAESFLEAVAANPSSFETAGNSTPFAPPQDTPSQAHPLAAFGDLERAIGELSDENPSVRKHALERIGWMGKDAEPALSAVKARLQDRHPEVRAYAAKTLWDVNQNFAPEAVDTLKEMIDSTQPGARPLAAFYLGSIGPAAATALPTLKRALAHTETAEQLQIAEAVARINPQDPDAVSVLIGGLRDPEGYVRFQAAYALGEVSPVHAKQIVPALTAATGDPTEEVQQAAKLALANFSPDRIAATQVEEVQELSAPPAAETPEPPALQVATTEEQAAFPVKEAKGELSETPETVLFPETEAPMPVVAANAGEPKIWLPSSADSAPLVPPKENRLGLGKDYKPITAVNISITPKRQDEEGKLLSLPTNYGAAWLQDQGTQQEPGGVGRPWPVKTKQWAATGYCHQPLYFQEINLERYGHNFGPVLQPFVSGAAFFGRVPLLPYMMAADHPWECKYTLGRYRSGNGVPFRHTRLPHSTPGTVLEAAIITGMVFAIQ